MNARTTDSLLARRALAEKATPGPWKWNNFANNYGCLYIDNLPGHFVCDSVEAEDAPFLALNSPDVVMADIDEILRLREKVERLKKEADWLARICANQMLEGVDEASVQWWREKAREAARKAGEENQCKN